MHRFYVETPIAGAGMTVALSGEESAHAARVLRLRSGEEVRLLDGENLWAGELAQVDAKETTVLITEKCASPEAPAQAVLIQGLPKADKLELIAQKGTELGMWELWPVEMERSVAKADKADKGDKKRERLSRIALEAAKQSGRGIIPNFANPMSFKEAVKNLPGEKILFYEHGGEALRDIITPEMDEITIFIGPEGGFSEDEVAFAKANGVRTATLGPRILRTETAPITAASLIMYMTGNLE